MTSAETSMSAARNASAAPSEPGRLDAWTGAIVFLAFAAAYFCSALVRAITATLSPVLTQDFSLHALQPLPPGFDGSGARGRVGGACGQSL